MNNASRYSGNFIFVKGRMTAGLTTFADVGVMALGASTGLVCHAAMAIRGK